jgi:hypothetical protein
MTIRLPGGVSGVMKPGSQHQHKPVFRVQMVIIRHPAAGIGHILGMLKGMENKPGVQFVRKQLGHITAGGSQDLLIRIYHGWCIVCTKGIK